MANQLNRSALWIALSDLFVDGETDYTYVARVAKDYPLPEVEFELFERVAPVCIGNMFSPAPPIWGAFNEKQLVQDIEEHIQKRASQGGVGRTGSFLFELFMRAYCSRIWSELKREIDIQKSSEQ